MELIITNKKGVSFDVIYDAENYDLIKDYSWYINSGGYVVAFDRLNYNGIVFMHRLIMNLSKYDKLEIDHINKVTTDNRKINLRICTPSENRYNREGLNKTSKYKGVSWYKNAKLWRANIGYMRKIIMLGYFKNEIDAAKAYDNAAKKYHKEYAKLNFD